MLNQSTLSLRREPAPGIVRGGSGPPLVWLHGMAAPTPEDPLLNALARHHEVIAPLMPGLASLEELAELPTVHDLVLFYDAILAELGVESATLAGHGFGAMLAARSDAWIPPAYAEDFAALIEGARAAYLEGGHMAPYEDPAGFVRIIEGFVGGAGD